MDMDGTGHGRGNVKAERMAELVCAYCGCESGFGEGDRQGIGQTRNTIWYFVNGCMRLQRKCHHDRGMGNAI